ncbi:MAG: hypothetical protein HKN31_12375 [Pricia sp.]|nr:hypothetical protein [Pricia sp.]
MTRPISDACLKCHVTFAKNTDASGKGNTYENNNFIYGIDCERCHRPAEKHVIYHRANPDSVQPKFIMLADTLSRQQSLDICAQCHSGLRSQQLKGGPFSFMAGENLELYSRNYYFNRPGAKLDVHGNQYGLLTSSKCFKESPKMDCTTCHNPHKNQRGDTSYFNHKCISCHETLISMCTAPKSEINAMANNCIACHMPLSPSETMKVKLTQDEDEAPIMIRSHLIGVYPNSAQMK